MQTSRPDVIDRSTPGRLYAAAAVAPRREASRMNAPPRCATRTRGNAYTRPAEHMHDSTRGHTALQHNDRSHWARCDKQSPAGLTHRQRSLFCKQSTALVTKLTCIVRNNRHACGLQPAIASAGVELPNVRMSGAWAARAGTDALSRSPCGAVSKVARTHEAGAG